MSATKSRRARTWASTAKRCARPKTSRPPSLLALIDGLNRRPDIDGILVQLPLPAQIDSKAVLLAVDPEKDVDGFHPMNVGNLVAGRPGPRPCTPAGIMELLKRHGLPIAGRRAVVVGRSDIVGKPAALMLLHEHATVTICHSKTPDLPAVCREADILVAAIGRPAMIDARFIKPGATVIDVGMNRLDTPRGGGARFPRRAAETGRFEPGAACWWATWIPSTWPSWRAPTRRCPAAWAR